MNLRTNELPPQVPARRPKKGDAKVRTGVRRRSGRVTGAGGEASKARNAGVCLRAGWRLRRPAAGAPSASAARRLRRTCPKRSAGGRLPSGREQVSGRFVGGIQAAVASPAEADSRPRGVGQICICRSRVRARIRPVGMRYRGVPDKPPSRSMPSAGPCRHPHPAGALPPECPAGPCRQTHAAPPQIVTKCRIFFVNRACKKMSFF